MPSELSESPRRDRPAGPRWLIARGARAAEEAVLDEVERLLGEGGGTPQVRPVRVVVPSNSLRLHLSGELVRRRGRAVLGVAVQTLYGAALEILERGGEAVPRGRLLFDVLARRLAGEERELAAALEPLVDGYGAVAATVRDLLDAGLTPDHADAAEEALAVDGPAVASGAEVARARALVRVAADLARGAEALGIGRPSSLFTCAAERVVSDPEGALPSRAVVVHGFADATGVGLDLLEALLRHPRAVLVLDHPPDPASPAAGRAAQDEPAPPPVPPAVAGTDTEGEADHPLARAANTSAETDGEYDRPLARAAAAAAPETDGEPGPAFTDRVRARLAPLFPAGPEAVPPREQPGALLLAAFAAGTAEAEARELAVRVRALIDGGVRPEAIGVVVRDPELARIPLRRHFGRLAVPFSGAGPRADGARGSLTPPGRRAQALVELLRRGGDLPADRWLDAAERLGGERLPARHRIDLRLAFFALGAGRVRDVARLDVDRYLKNDSYPLPVRQGLRPVRAADEEEAPDAEDAREEAGDDRAEGVALRRRVPGERLRAASTAAAELVAQLSAWPAEATAEEHFRRLGELTREGLGWRLRPGRAGAPAPASAPVLNALEAAAAEVPPRLVLTLDELRLLLGRALEAVGWSALGGAGGGVQVLGALAARGRTFEHLFVAGLSRGVFPRTVRPDPLLSDPLRRVLARVIPEVPVKQRGFDEERYLFAQLLSAAPRVTLSWSAEGPDGRPLPPSPLVERLAARTGLAAERAPAVWSAAGAWAAGGAAAVRPAREHAALAALHGPRKAFAEALPAAVAEARRALLAPAEAGGEGGALAPAALAAARLAVLDEVDPDLTTPEGRGTRRRLGPYLGFIGALDAAPGADPRRSALYVTALERMAACPWQVFLERLLRLEPTPDPVQSLPDVNALLLGNAVHKVLETLVDDARGDGAAPETLEEARARGVSPAAWPPADELKSRLRDVAEALVVEEGIALAGMARVLERRAIHCLAEAAATDWRAGSVPAIGAEVVGAIEVADAGGRPRRLAFKADRADARARGLVLTDYKTGRPISTAKTDTYRRRHLLAEIAAGRKLQAAAYALAEGAAAGRYLFLKPGLATDAREFEVTAADREAADAFAAAARAALAAWDAGAFFPRVVLPDENREPLACRWCAVAEACVRGDSGARLRLFEWANRRAGEDDGDGAEPDAATAAELSGGEEALLGVWELARRPERPGKRR